MVLMMAIRRCYSKLSLGSLSAASFASPQARSSCQRTTGLTVIPRYLSTAKVPRDETNNNTRLSKLLAANLNVSRRESERWIRQGLVSIAGEVVRTPHLLVNWDDLSSPGILSARGKAVPVLINPEASNADATSTKPSSKVWLVHKLPRELVAEHDPQGRPCLMERLASHGGLTGRHNKQRTHPIGRLDMSTEGLILVTNDSTYKREMELPQNKLHRTYRVRAHGLVTVQKLQRMQRGITVDGVRYAPMKVAVDDKAASRKPKRRRQASTSTNTWLQVTCTEGKNRQIRNVLEHLGCKYCGYQLGFARM